MERPRCVDSPGPRPSIVSNPCSRMGLDAASHRVPMALSYRGVLHDRRSARSLVLPRRGQPRSGKQVCLDWCSRHGRPSRGSDSSPFFGASLFRRTPVDVDSSSSSLLSCLPMAFLDGLSRLWHSLFVQPWNPYLSPPHRSHLLALFFLGTLHRFPSRQSSCRPLWNRTSALVFFRVLGGISDHRYVSAARFDSGLRLGCHRNRARNPGARGG